MNRKDWPFVLAMALLVTGMLVLLVGAIGTVRQQELDGQTAKVCVSHGMQWVESNCMKISK